MPIRAAGVRPVHLHKVASLRSGRKYPVTGGSHGAVWLCLDALLFGSAGQSPSELEALYPVAYVLQDFLTVASRVVHTRAELARMPEANTGAETLSASLSASAEHGQQRHVLRASVKCFR